MASISNLLGSMLVVVANAGFNSKFLGVLDFRFKLLPLFANMLPADKQMDALIIKIRAPYETKLAQKLAVTEGTLYRRGNFNGTGDQLFVDALIEVHGADLAF